MFHFFGLGPNYKLGLHEEIFSLCYHGKGGFVWDDVYSLPIHLRRFYIQQITKAIEEKNKAENAAYNKSTRAMPSFNKPSTPPRR